MSSKRDLTHPPKRWEKAFYAGTRAVLLGFARVWFRLSVDGREKVPGSGAYIVSPVHRSNIDFLLLLATSKRRTRYLAKDSLFRGIWDPIFSALGAIPVARGSADRDALNTCIEVVRAGEPLVIFPEGTRQHGPEVQDLFDGAAFVQSRTGVPIVPIGIGGSEAAMPRGSKVIRPRKVHLVVGDAIAAPQVDGAKARRQALRATTAQLKVVLQDLFDRAQAAAGTPNG